MHTVPPGHIVVATFYSFRPLPDFARRRAPLDDVARAGGIRGTLLLASEGINGTIAGERRAIAAVLAHIRNWPGFGDLAWQDASTATMPFLRLKVRLKSEIVTMGVENIDPCTDAGTYVAPRDWNSLISRDDVLVIDARNDYEVAIGTFAGTVNPKIRSFREFPAWARTELSGPGLPKVAMFCTGGIRCEKATAYLNHRGLHDVYHLQGGILRYLREVPEELSHWRGECFVFDRRVSVGHGLKPGSYQLCAICRTPFHSAAGAGGFASHACADCTSSVGERRLARAETRQRQIELAQSRGREHFGPSAETSRFGAVNGSRCRARPDHSLRRLCRNGGDDHPAKL